MARWNFEDIMDKLMPLLEKKLAFNMEMASRTMSLEEKKEANKTDFEYKKLEAQITNDKDKLTWEKEKLTTAIKGDYDLQTLRNNGTLDVKRLEGLNERDKQKIVEEGLNRRADQTEGGLNRRADQTDRTAESNKYLNTLGVVLGHAVERTGTDAQGNPYSQKPTAEVGNVARSLMEKTGLAEPAATPQPQGRNVAGEAENANMLLTQYKKAGNTADATKFFQSLDPAVQAATLTRYQQDSAAAPVAAAIPPAAPVQPAVQPVATPLEPARPPVQPTSIFQKAGGAVRSFMDAGNPEAARVEAQRTATAEGVKNLPGTIAGAVRSTGEAVAGAGREFMAGYDPEKEKKRQDALRRARGLTVGGL